jgi:hypothetical protein
LDKRLFEAIPSLFFSFHDKKQVDYIKKIFKSGKIEKYKKYALYTLIDFINSKFQNNNLMGSLHSMDVLSNDWILVNEKLTCSQNCLYELLICLDKIIIDNDDYQELKWLRKREYTKDFCFHKNILSGLLNCPQFLKTLFIYFVKNNIQFQTLDLNFINKKLQNMKKHYEDQIAMAKTYKNKYTKYYQMCLDDINQIENLKNNEYVQKPKEIGKQEVILSANNTKNVSENNIQKSLNAQQLPDKEPMREKDFSECQLDADELNSLFKSLCYSGNKEIKQPDWKQNESFKWLLDYYMKNNNEYKKFILSNDLSETTNTIPHLKDLLSRFKIITSHFIDFLSEAAKKPKPS